MIKSLAAHYKVKIDGPFNKLPAKFRKIVLYGSNGEEIKFKYEKERDKGKATRTSTHPYEGVIPNLQRRYRETESNTVREELGKLLASQPCKSCKGERLNEAARHVLVDGHNLPSIVSASIAESQALIKKLKLKGQRKDVAEKITDEISQRLSFLVNVGLDYLSLDRSADTLSGGEAQRIRLASQIGAGLMGVMYVLDEPSIGLHQRDNDKLLKTLAYLKELGNTVIVVEHDEDAIRAADHILDIGPGAGVHGGEIVASGTLKDILKSKRSLTGQYLSGKKSVEVPKRIKPGKDMITINEASGNNLKKLSVDIPVGLFNVITGVSGSGKSTLINDTLYQSAAATINKSKRKIAPVKSITGINKFDKIVDIDQSPIGRTPRSTPATYSGLFSVVRELFSNTPEARSRGYKAGRFSFNVKGGRCEACQGDGLIKVEMHFLPWTYATKVKTYTKY